MQGMFSKLSSYAALIGVIGAIGGGFMAWGEFNNRIAQLENKEFTVNETVDLTDTHDRIINGDKEVMQELRLLSQTIEALKSDMSVNQAAIDFLDAKIDELKASLDNPLL
jgi:chromosome segregation ATPase